jgi:hypothetical protein
MSLDTALQRMRLIAPGRPSAGICTVWSSRGVGHGGQGQGDGRAPDPELYRNAARRQAQGAPVGPGPVEGR